MQTLNFKFLFLISNIEVEFQIWFWISNFDYKFLFLDIAFEQQIKYTRVAYL